MRISDGFTDAVGNTPLIRLRRLSEETGCEILGKAEFMNPGGSVKDRAAKWIVLDAERRGLLVTSFWYIRAVNQQTGQQTGLTRDGLFMIENGKITTPVHVVDKATKLETIYDRIHMLDTRFEVLKRDAEIELLKRRIGRLEQGRNPGGFHDFRIDRNLAGAYRRLFSGSLRAAPGGSGRRHPMRGRLGNEFICRFALAALFCRGGQRYRGWGARSSTQEPAHFS